MGGFGAERKNRNYTFKVCYFDIGGGCIAFGTRKHHHGYWWGLEVGVGNGFFGDISGPAID